ncbi:hypothetical protein CNMCM7691_002483 [Aspergillus felis]|uniref:N-acetyltransferase domain-containing protein n=1 Tax=Aspergillus felis TaxID=1287682 RepID=A0A8H6R2U6_9EURO|nr:hypothetical protein CNMCM7691_002483 [Aspergillus felis]
MLSVIHPNSHRGLPVVAHHHLYDNALATQNFPGLEGYRFMSASYKPNGEDERLSKHMNKSLKSLESVCRLLHRPNDKPKTASEKNQPDNPPEIVTGDGAFSLEFPLSGQQSIPDPREIFTRLQLRWGNGTTSTQYFRAHIPSIKPTLLDGPFNSIHINTGICLFSKTALSMDPGNDSLGSDSEKVTIPRTPDRNEDLTLYELETITRLSLAIADTAALIGPACRDHCSPININIDIPDFQYFWTACELLERNLVDVTYVNKWIDTMNERRSLLFNIMSSMIHSSLRERQVSNVKICLTSGTEAAVESIMRSLPAGPMPSLDELLDKLQKGHSDAEQWKNFLANLDPRHWPSTISELGRLMYVFKAVKPVLTHGPQQLLNRSSQSRQEKNLIIMVDNSTEWRIFDRARTFLKRYTKSPTNGASETIMVGLFPLEKIFVAGARRSDLYLEDPGSDMWSESEASRVGPLEVIDTVYGSIISERLRSLCHRAGFKAAMRETPREFKLSILSKTMRFQLSEVHHDTDEFEEVVACEVASFEHPQQSIFRFFYPIFGHESEVEKQTAFRNLVELQRQWSRDDPDVVWIQAIDTQNNNKVVGGLLMKVHKENRPAQKDDDEHQSAFWYPAGSQRKYIDECLRIFTAPHEKYMQRPHVYLYIGFVLPEYRQQGVADMFLADACRRADELGIEAWLESVVAMGVPIYMRHGFIPFRKHAVEPQAERPDDEWKDMEEKMQPLRFWPMWRPPHGKFVPGETNPPWNEFMSSMLSKL